MIKLLVLFLFMSMMILLLFEIMIAISDIKHFLAQFFPIKDLGTLWYFLGIEVSRSIQRIILWQGKYTLDILSNFGMLGSRPSNFPVEERLRLRPNNGISLPYPTD